MPDSMVKGVITSANLTVPTPTGLVNVPNGMEVEVPKDFLDAMVEAGRMEASAPKRGRAKKEPVEAED